MNTETFSVRLDRSAKTRLQKLAKSTGRSRSYLAAEAISAYLDTNEWQVAGITKALSSLDRGKGIAQRGAPTEQRWSVERPAIRPTRWRRLLAAVANSV